jgi:hypothetical protein
MLGGLEALFTSPRPRQESCCVGSAYSRDGYTDAITALKAGNLHDPC